MNSKKQLIIVGAIGLLLVVTAYSLQDKKAQVEDVASYTSEEKVDEVIEEEKDPNSPTALEVGVELGTDGTVVAVDSSGIAADGPALINFKTDGNSVYTIAVPSMGLPNCVAANQIADVSDIVPGDRVSIRGKTDEEGRIVPCESDTHQLTVKGVYKNENVGLDFAYLKSPNGYLLQTEGDQFSNDPSFVSGAVLMNKKEAEEMLLSDVPREFPPAIRLRVYDNPEKRSPLEWTKEKTVESNYEFAMAEPVEITVGNESAVGYTTDGLYLTDTFVVGYGDYILIVTGEYVDTESAIFTDLEQLVDTITFTRA
jgi:hypothetical protein